MLQFFYAVVFFHRTKIPGSVCDEAGNFCVRIKKELLVQIQHDAVFAEHPARAAAVLDLIPVS